MAPVASRDGPSSRLIPDDEPLITALLRRLSQRGPLFDAYLSAQANIAGDGREWHQNRRYMSNESLAKVMKRAKLERLLETQEVA